MVSRNTALAAVAAGLAIVAMSRRSSVETSEQLPSTSSPSRRPDMRVDRVFMKRLLALLRICVPGAFSREMGMLVSLMAVLLVRTRLQIMAAKIVGSTAKFLVQRDARKFVAGGVVDIGLWSLPCAVVSAGHRYLTELLECRVRSNLQRHLHDAYLQQSTVYKVSAGSQVEHADHRITKDVLAFAEEVSQIFPLIFKPSIDVIVFILQLSRNGGVMPPMLMIAYYLVAGTMMRAMMPNFAKLTAQTQQREASFRAIHSQVIQHAEEVAFYRGESTERNVADSGIASLLDHQIDTQKLKSYTDFVDAILIKYGATCVGYAVCSLGVFGLGDGASAAERTRVYIQSSQLYIPLAQAIGKLVLLHNRITALAAYTTRVAEVRELLDNLNTASRQNTTDSITVQPHSDAITLKNAKIVTPSGETLLNDFSIKIERTKHVLVMGNNGSGKTSLLRVLVGLWPLAAGHITRPPLSDFVFVPQRTYLPHGNMREQLIFPDTKADAERKGVSDERIMEMVEAVGLTSVVLREGGLDGFKAWHEVLSGGERQRVAFVRVLYHRPAFAVLDEATSAVSQDIEPAMYAAAQRCGTTLVTVSHRESLKKFHSTVVVLDGEGNATVHDGDA